jgi:hypothetical protein
VLGRHDFIPTDLISLDKSSGIRIDHILANDGIEVVTGAQPATTQATTIPLR